ncbi:MAG: hypothetical protein Q4D79_07630 [Propionibacteriaceae bacterium]|nr:hypothetical protein [Propionibacteriaceae bacterium]
MILAIATLVMRFLALGSIVGWISGRAKAPLSALWSGVALAAFAVVVAVVRILDALKPEGGRPRPVATAPSA